MPCGPCAPERNAFQSIGAFLLLPGVADATPERGRVILALVHELGASLVVAEDFIRKVEPVGHKRDAIFKLVGTLRVHLQVRELLTGLRGDIDKLLRLQRAGGQTKAENTGQYG